VFAFFRSVAVVRRTVFDIGWRFAWTFVTSSSIISFFSVPEASRAVVDVRILPFEPRLEDLPLTVDSMQRC